MKKQLMIFDFVCLGIGAIFLTFVAILQNCGINITNGSVIGIVITVLLFILILLSTANVFGFDCTVSNITFLRPLLLIISLYIFYCMPFMGFFGKSGNVWNNIMIAFLGIMASRFFFYISKSAMAEKMVKSPFVYTEGAEMFSKAELFFKYFSFFIVVITVAIIILNMTTNDIDITKIFI